MAKNPKKQRRSQAQWLEVVGEWKASGLTQAEFYQRHSIKLTTFRWWCWRLSSATPNTPQAGDIAELARLYILPKWLIASSSRRWQRPQQAGR